MAGFRQLLRNTPQGLYCPPGDFHIDPVRPVDRCVITHGHSDHARSGHGAVLATPQSLAIMAARYGEGFAAATEAARYGEKISRGDVAVRLVPAGHVLGSAQVVLAWKGVTAVISGDYKRRSDPTCPPFEPVPCNLFVSEATFGLPVFHFPDASDEVAKLLHSVALFPERTHLVGAYALGKAQRLIALLRQTGYEKPIYVHGALDSMVTADNVTAFKAEMDKAGADYKFVSLDGAKHGFTNPDADRLSHGEHGGPDIGYNKAADEKSWADMKAFLQKIFG